MSVENIGAKILTESCFYVLMEQSVFIGPREVLLLVLSLLRGVYFLVF